jgi:hypothetical protein
MNNYMQSIALIEMSISCSIICIWLMQKLIPGEIPFGVRVLLLLMLGNIFFWPLGMSMELPLAGYVRGVTGDLSIVTLLLLWSSLIPKGKAAPIGFKFAIGLIAIGFYPMALGLGMIDPYAWGYGSIGLLIAVLFFAAICGLIGWTKGVWILALAVISWSGHWHESRNLWDYVIDPFLAFWALFGSFYYLYRQHREKAQSEYLFRAG